MKRTKYPLSLKVALVLLSAMFVICLFVIPSNSSNQEVVGSDSGENILPDMELPWNKSAETLVTTLNKIYQYQGALTEWELHESDIENIYYMVIKGSDKIGPFKFVFNEGKLSGYLAEFAVMKYSTLIYSADVNYPKKTEGVGRGFVKTQSREFRTYERDLKFGHVELFMVWDKDSLRVRIQAKYTHTGNPKKKKKSEATEGDDGKALIETDVSA